MIHINLPLSATAMQHGADFLLKLKADMAQIQAEVSPAWDFMQGIGSAVEELEVATPAPIVAPVEELEVATPAPVVEPAPLQPVNEELVEGPNLAGSGYTLEQYRAVNWTDEQLIAAGYLRVVTVAPKPDAPGASVAPPPPGASAPAAGGTVELDKNGLPWDERIHSNAAEKLSAKGEWKRRRGIDDALVATVEAELRAVMAVGKPAAGVAHTTAAAPNAAPAPTAVASAPVNPPAPVTAGGDPTTFGDFVIWAAGRVTGSNPILTQADVALAVQAAGLTVMPDLQARPDLIPVVLENIRRTKPGA